MTTLRGNQGIPGVRGWLRATAEDRVARSPDVLCDMTTKNPGDIIHELKIHQIELEIQNEELKKARKRSEESRDRYLDLIDLARSGYYILTDKGQITQVNLPGAMILGTESKTLIRDRFRKHITRDSLPVWDRFFFHVLNHNDKQTCTLRIRQDDGTILHTRAEGVRMEKEKGTYLVGLAMSDISDMEYAEAELRESEERYRLLFEEAPFPYQSLDAEGKVLDVNKAWLKALGYERNQVIGTWFGDFLPLDQKRIFRERYSLFMKNGEINESVFPIQKKNAETILISLTGNIGYYPDGSYRQTQCVLQELTGRIRADDVLRKSEEKFRALFNNIETGVFFQDADGTLSDCNPAALILFGLSREEFLGRRSIDPGSHIIREDGTPFHSDELPSMVALMTGNPVRDVIAGIYHSDISDYVWVSIDAIPQFRSGRGDPYQVFVTLHDITAEKKVRDLLDDNEHFVHEILRLTPNVIYLYDLDTRSTVFTNREIEELLGYPVDPSEDKNSFSFESMLHPDDQALMDQHLKRMKEAEDGKVFVCEYRMRHADGTWILLRSQDVVFSRDSQGEVRRILGSAEDITAQKEAEELIRSSLSEKEMLLREIQHRVKNNLSSIISLINLQMASFPSDSDKSHYQDLEARIRSMALVYESLYQVKNISQISVQTYIKNLVQYLVQIYMKRQDIDFQFNIDPIWLSLNTIVPFGLVVNEIITNALKYAFPPGFCGEEVRGDTCIISISMHREGSDLVLSISDNGIGIPQNIANSPQTLGLYLINFIIEHQLRGSVDTDTSCGTRYAIKLPVRDDEVSNL